MKPVIGIISTRVDEKDRPFMTKTSFNELYPKRIIQAGGIPIGVIFPNNEFNTEVLDICDGFVMQGGSTIYSSNINTVHYALERKKPILGICMGMQTMVGYEWVMGEFENIFPTYNEIGSFFHPEDEVNFIEKVKGHDNLDPFYLSKVDESKHAILLDNNSLLTDILKDSYIEMPSVHGWKALDKLLEHADGNVFKVTGRSTDGVIEVIESNIPDWWAIGVQFHPELEEKNLPLFRKLVSEAKIKKLRK